MVNMHGACGRQECECVALDFEGRDGDHQGGTQTWHFAENYVQELISKVTQMPPDVRWHFIGGLQSNKAKELVRCCGPLLAAIETVDSTKLADKIDAAVASLPEALRHARAQPLEVLIQVNTSPWEGTKNGCDAADVVGLADHIRAAFPNVKLAGLMTIGAPGEPFCFTALCDCRDALARHLKVQPSTLRLSMGMSGDFEEAVAAGSDSVRVGSRPSPTVIHVVSLIAAHSGS